MRIERVLSHPLFLLGALSLGLAIGVLLPDLAKSLAPIGHVYVNMVKMVVLPYLVAVIITALALSEIKLTSVGWLVRLVPSLPLTTVAAAVVTTVVVKIVQPGIELGDDDRGALAMLARNVGEPELTMTLFGSEVHKEDSIITQAIQHLVPRNFFEALGTGQVLQVVFFCLLFGFALRNIPTEAASPVLRLLATLRSGLQSMVNALVLVLPLALIAIIATQISEAGSHALMAMGGFLESLFIGAGAIALISLMVLSWQTRTHPLRALGKLRAPLLMALVSRNPVDMVPPAVQAMGKGFGYTGHETGVVLPLTLLLNRAGLICFYLTATHFMAAIYHIDLTFGQEVMLILASLMGSVVGAGSAGVLGVAMLSPIAMIVGVPMDAALPLFLVVDNISDLARGPATVLTGCALASFVCEKSETKP